MSAGYGPLIFYLSALFQYLSGERLIGEIILVLAGFTTGYLLLFLLIYRISSRWQAAAAGTLIAVLLIPRFYKYYVVLGPAVFLYALPFVTTEKDKKLPFFMLGCTVAVNALFRFDFGIYCVFTAVLTLILLFARHKQPQLFLRQSALVICGIILPFLPWLIFLMTRGELTGVLSDIYRALSGRGGGLSLPAPVLNITDLPFTSGQAFSLLFYLMPLTPLLLLLHLQSLKNRKHTGLFLFLSSIFAYCLYLQALHRSDIHHFLQAIFPIG